MISSTDKQGIGLRHGARVGEETTLRFCMSVAPPGRPIESVQAATN